LTIAVKLVIHAVGVAATTPNASHPAALSDAKLLGTLNLTASEDRPRINVSAAASANGTLPLSPTWSDGTSTEPTLVFDFAEPSVFAAYELYASATDPTTTAPVSFSVFRKPGTATTEGRRLMTLTAPDDADFVFIETITIDQPVVLVPGGLIGGTTALLPGFVPPASPPSPPSHPPPTGRWASCTCPATSPSEPPSEPPSPSPPSPPAPPQPPPFPPPFPPPPPAPAAPPYEWAAESVAAVALGATAAVAGTAALGAVLLGKAGSSAGNNWRVAFNPASATTTTGAASGLATPLLVQQLRGGVATAAAGQWTWRSVLGAPGYARVQ